MIRVGVLVSGGGTNLQAIIDAVKNKTITNASLEVVISNKKRRIRINKSKRKQHCSRMCLCKRLRNKRRIQQSIN